MSWKGSNRLQLMKCHIEVLSLKFLFFFLQPWTLLFEYLQLLFYTQMLISYKTLYSILLGHFTLHFMSHSIKNYLPKSPSAWLCVVVQLLSCVRLCIAIDYSPPGSFVHEIFQARILEWVAISFSIKFQIQYNTFF